MTNDLIGTQLGKHEILAEVGHEGMVTVYRTHQASHYRYVAVNVLARQLIQDEKLRLLSEREAKTVSQLNHPKIVPLYDGHPQRDLVFLVIQVIEGATLSRHMGHPLPAVWAVRIAGDVAQALDYAYRHGIIHRDVKPSNILLTEDERPLLTDFGIARIVQETRLTRIGTSLGTAEYMSPEQAKGDSLGFCTDVYSLTIVLYEMLIGRSPFRADTDIAVLHQQVYGPPPRPRQLRSDIPRRLEKVILKALAKDPAKRYPTAGATAQALERALHSGISLWRRRPALFTPSRGAEAEPATVVRQPEGVAAPPRHAPALAARGRFPPAGHRRGRGYCRQQPLRLQAHLIRLSTLGRCGMIVSG